MNDKSVPISRWLRDWVLRIYCDLLVLFAIYIFSIGPMYWKIYEAYEMNGSTFVAQLYFPVVWACDKSTHVADWVDWYVRLWVM